MNKILEEYIDNMFKGIKKTSDIKEIIADLKISTNDKFLDLKNRGINENESIGRIISEFGSVEEILDEINYEKKIQYNNGVVRIRKTTIREKIVQIMFLLCVLFYLITGFGFGLWGKTWVVFPIAGIVSAIIAVTANKEE